MADNTMSWTPSEQYRKVAEANRLSYSTYADQYDKTETCVVSRRFQTMLQRDLDGILQMIPGYPETEIRALDACGGSGNVALKLLDRGVTVTLCDLSPELLELFQLKCEQRSFLNHEVVCQEIGDFLSATDRKFDLITFSSALHHIEDYTSVIKLASTHLNDAGFIYTVFDPVKWKFPAWQMIWLDYLLFKILNHADDVFPAIKRKLNKKLKKAKSEHDSMSPKNAEVAAEYHVRNGIDDFALVDAMEKIGVRVVWHNRYTDSRYAPFRFLLSIFGCTTSFKLLLRK